MSSAIHKARLQTNKEEGSEMSGLNKKAKTLEQWLYGNQCTSLNEVMVRLEDAQKDKQELLETLTDTQERLDIATDALIKFQDWHKELKQKIQQLKDLFSCFIEHIPKHERDVNASYANFIWEINRKFEELLNEEKAKPT
jgi:hypothetical protein